MATIVDLLRRLGLGSAPDGGQALCGPLVLPQRPMQAVNLDLPADLFAAWQSLTGRHTAVPHQSALAACKSYEPVALVGPGTMPTEDLALLALARLRRAPDGVALWLLPHGGLTAEQKWLDTLASSVGISCAPLSTQVGRREPVQLIRATYAQCHQLILGNAERAWHWLWPRLEMLVLPAVHVAAATEQLAHAVWLLRRLRRLSGRTPLVAAGSVPAPNLDAVFTVLDPQPWHQVDATPGGTSRLVALWRCDDREQAIKRLAGTLLDRLLGVTVLGRNPQETEQLRTRLADVRGLEVGLDPYAARIAIVAGVPSDSDERLTLLHRGYRLLIILVGNSDWEQCYSRNVELLLQHPELPVPDVSGVAAAHLQWAAAEQPLVTDEITAWQVHPTIDELAEQGRLRYLADGTWYPTPVTLDHQSGWEVVIAEPRPVQPTTSAHAPPVMLTTDISPTMPRRARVYKEVVGLPVPDRQVEIEPLFREAADPQPDVGAMIARIRTLRDEHTPLPPPADPAPSKGRTGAERFRAGQRVSCVPYGEGLVRAIRLVEGREQLVVQFDEHGALPVDPGINLVRPVEAAVPEMNDEFF